MKRIKGSNSKREVIMEEVKIPKSKEPKATEHKEISGIAKYILMERVATRISPYDVQTLIEGLDVEKYIHIRKAGTPQEYMIVQFKTPSKRITSLFNSRIKKEFGETFIKRSIKGKQTFSSLRAVIKYTPNVDILVAEFPLCAEITTPIEDEWMSQVQNKLRHVMALRFVKDPMTYDLYDVDLDLTEVIACQFPRAATEQLDFLKTFFNATHAKSVISMYSSMRETHRKDEFNWQVLYRKLAKKLKGKRYHEGYSAEELGDFYPIIEHIVSHWFRFNEDRKRPYSILARGKPELYKSTFFRVLDRIFGAAQWSHKKDKMSPMDVCSGFVWWQEAKPQKVIEKDQTGNLLGTLLRLSEGAGIRQDIKYAYAQDLAYNGMPLLIDTNAKVSMFQPGGKCKIAGIDSSELKALQTRFKVIKIKNPLPIGLLIQDDMLAWTIYRLLKAAGKHRTVDDALGYDPSERTVTEFSSILNSDNSHSSLLPVGTQMTPSFGQSLESITLTRTLQAPAGFSFEQIKKTDQPLFGSMKISPLSSFVPFEKRSFSGSGSYLFSSQSRSRSASPLAQQAIEVDQAIQRSESEIKTWIPESADWFNGERRTPAFEKSSLDKDKLLSIEPPPVQATTDLKAIKAAELKAQIAVLQRQLLEAE